MAGGNSTMLNKAFIDVLVTEGEELLIEAGVNGGVVSLDCTLVI